MAAVEDPESAARTRVLNGHPGLIARTIECADAVAAGWDGDGTTDAGAVAESLSVVLDRAGVTSRLPSVIEDAVAAIGAELSAKPVPASPYVVVTSRGPVLRATAGGGRLVVTLAVFEVERGDGGPPRYVRGAATPGEAVEVEFRTR